MRKKNTKIDVERTILFDFYIARLFFRNAANSDKTEKKIISKNQALFVTDIYANSTTRR